MEKTLIIKENKKHIALKVTVVTTRGVSTTEIARFSNSGMGFCALGSSGRYLLQHMNFDHVMYEGSQDTYDRLVALGVIEVLEVAA